MKNKTICILFFLIILLQISCGYKLSGSGKYIPSDLKTIVIPDFKNNTTEYRAEHFVTFAIRDEFIKRSAMKLVDTTSGADSILEGTISRFDISPVNYTSLGSVDMFRVSIFLNVKLINLKNNKIVFEKKGMSFVGNYEIETSDFFSQERDALRKISKKFASSIVSAILENF